MISIQDAHSTAKNGFIEAVEDMPEPGDVPLGLLDVPPGIGFSTITDTSPQCSHTSVYTETTPLSGRVGFSQTLAGGGPALVSVTFASPMSNLIFYIANLDFSSLDFTPSFGGGLTGMTLLSGKGGGGDGIGLGGPVIFDAAPGTSDGTPPAVAPPLAGPRSAYGSVLLSGTYTSIDFLIVRGAGIDNANFTFATPEPRMTTLAAMGFAGIFFRRRRRIG